MLGKVSNNHLFFLNAPLNDLGIGWATDLKHSMDHEYSEDEGEEEESDGEGGGVLFLSSTLNIIVLV